MPKSKKKKNRDFQKVKLKLGKERRSGNETDISFKTRTIKVSQTLKDFSSSNIQEPHTKKRLTFEDLLKRCDANKSCSQRLSAVEGLRELALVAEGSAAQPRFWAAKFGVLMSKLGILFSDPEPVVRKGVLRLCKTIFSLVSEQSISLDYFSASLCSALTHFSDEVRHDALVLFDLVLDKWPEKLIDNYCRLVPALINQISSYMVTNKTARGTLAINPGSKFASQKWRAEVLVRLTKIVETYVKKRRRETAPPAEHEMEVYHFGIDYPVIRGPCVPASWKRLWTQWPTGWRSDEETQEYSSLASDTTQLEKFICSILPVIKGCWEEEFAADDTVGPSHSASESSRCLTQASLPVLQAVVGLLYSFKECWRCIFDNLVDNVKVDQCSWFLSEFLRQLREFLLPQFPISITENAVKSKKGQRGQNQADSGQSADTSSVQVSVLKLNLMVSEILSSFPPVEPDWPEVWVEPEEWQGEVVSFMRKNLKRTVEANMIGCLGKVLRNVFFHYPYTEQVGRLLARVQKRFISAHALSSEKRMLVELLADLAYDWKELSPYHANHARIVGKHIRHELLESFLWSLPKLLVEICGADNVEQTEQIAIRATKAMRSFHSRILTAAVLHYLPQLLDDRTGVFARLPQSCHESMYEAVMWAYHYIPIPEPILKQIELIIRHPRVDKRIASNLFTRVNTNLDDLRRIPTRSPNNQEDVENSMEHYLRFVFSVVVGHTTAELEAIDKAHEPEIGGLTRVVWTCTAEQFEKHCFVMPKGLQYFYQYLKTSDPNLDAPGAYVMDTMSKVWNGQILEAYKSLSVLTVFGALKHWRAMFVFQLARGKAVHTDNTASPQNFYPVEAWDHIVRQTLPLFKTHMRPFTRLTFSLLYSMVAMEMGPEEEVVMPPTGMVEEMMKVVVSLMEKSLRMLRDLLKVMAQFVQEQQSEQESMRTTLLITRLWAVEELQLHQIRFGHLLRLELNSYVAAVMEATPEVETTQWWLAFKNACGLSHAPADDR